LLAVAIMAALAVVYRVGPDRETSKTRWRSPGALVATVLFLLISGGFSLYVSSLGGGGSYEATYGALAGVVVLLFWLFLSAFAILLGAEVNNELERQAKLENSTAGSMSMTRKDAYLADT
jgi:membrane protein